MELEREIEKYMGRELKAIGCLWYKWVSPGARGVPDRILITPDGKVRFVELKTSAGQVDPLQVRQIELLRSHGLLVYVIRGMAEAQGFIQALEQKFGRRKRGKG